MTPCGGETAGSLVSRWGGWWKRQLQNAQTLYRISLGVFGAAIVVTAVFGTILRP
jgi:hypothetical protein